MIIEIDLNIICKECSTILKGEHNVFNKKVYVKPCQTCLNWAKEEAIKINKG